MILFDRADEGTSRKLRRKIGRQAAMHVPVKSRGVLDDTRLYGCSRYIHTHIHIYICICICILLYITVLYPPCPTSTRKLQPQVSRPPPDASTQVRESVHLSVAASIV